MQRREFITLLGGAAAAWPFAARAQQPSRVWRIGFLAPAAPTRAMLTVFRDGLRERGYVEGKNLAIEVRWPQGPFEQNPDVTAELIRGNVDVIVAWASRAVIAARHATSTIPIVMASVGNPVAMGFVANLARPGGNVTGVSNISQDLSGKLVELFVEFIPRTKIVGVVRNPNNPGLTLHLRETENALRALGLQVAVVDASASGEFERAFQILGTRGVNGVVLLPDPSLIQHGRRIAELAQGAGMPTAF